MAADDAADGEEHEACFVCADASPPLLRACRCQNMWVHGPCLARLVVEVPAHCTGCVACGAPYAERVSFVERWRCAPRPRPWQELYADLWALLAFVAMLTLVVQVPEWVWTTGPLVGFLTIGFALVASLCWERCSKIYQFGIRRAGCCLCLCGRVERDAVVRAVDV